MLPNAIKCFEGRKFGGLSSGMKESREDKEIAKRRDAVLKRMLKMPPKPHAEVSGKTKKKSNRKKKSTK